MSKDYRSSAEVAATRPEGVPTTEMPAGADLAHRVVIEDSPKRVRACFAGRTIADSRRVKLMHETGHLPVYYFPQTDVDQDCLVATTHTTTCPVKGEARYWSVKVGQRTAANAVWNYPEPVSGCPDIAGLLAFYWDAMDAWYEEAEEVFVHPRDPYKRIEVLETTRHVEVAVDGATVADSHRACMLLETGLPVRYYLPKVDVRLDLLEPSATRTACPYKGRTSQYWTLEAGGNQYEDVAWCYEYPTPEALKIAGRICFYSEKVDLYIDGELQDRPATPWSSA